MPSFDTSSTIITWPVADDYRIAAFQGSFFNNSHHVWLDLTLTYSFPSGPTYFFDGPNYGNKGEISAGWAPFGISQQASAKAALAAWSAVANISFVEVPDDLNVGDLRFAFTGAVTAPTTGWAYSPTPNVPESGDVWITSKWAQLNLGASPSQTNGALTQSYSFDQAMRYLTVLHEIGHALGLSHPFAEVGETRYTAPLPEMEDGPNTTVMSYEVGPGSLGAPGRGVPTTPMIYDILAAQYMYGPNLAHNAGDTVYRFDMSSVRYETIWDAGGNDTIVATNQRGIIKYEGSSIFGDPAGHRGVQIDLRMGKGIDPFEQGVFGGQTGNRIGFVGDYASKTYSFDAPGTLFYGLEHLSAWPNIFIAYGAMIENAIGTDANDRLIGNEVNNRFTGGHGSDLIDGQGGIDTSVYLGPSSDYTVIRTATGFEVRANFTIPLAPPIGYSGIALPQFTAFRSIDRLQNVERLEFADKGIAFDLAAGQPAGNTVRLISAIFDTPYLTPEFVGIGLDLFGDGRTMEQVAQLAIGTSLFAQLAGSRSNADVVKLLYKNVIGVAPSAADLANFQGFLDGGAMTQAQLAVLAANSAQNAVNVDLVGLTERGVEFIPAG